jgi:hypothetical protein
VTATLTELDLEGLTLIMVNPQPRLYRIRVFDRDREVLTDRHYMVPLDLAAGPGLRATEGVLDAYLQALAHANGARGERVLGYFLRVEDPDTSRRVLDWPAKTWPEPRY